MEEMTCDTCASSYDIMEHVDGAPDECVQHCSSEDYNSPNYTHDMFMEDLPKGHCRFWAPK